MTTTRTVNNRRMGSPSEEGGGERERGAREGREPSAADNRTNGPRSVNAGGLWADRRARFRPSRPSREKVERHMVDQFIALGVVRGTVAARRIDPFLNVLARVGERRKELHGVLRVDVVV